MSVLVSGTAGAQVIALLAAPILTRLYSPEEFGVLVVYISLISLLAVVASLKYETAIPLPRKHSDAVTITILSIILVVTTTLIVTLCVVLGGSRLFNALGIPELVGVIWLVPVGILLVGLFQVVNYRAIRAQSFGALAKARIGQQISTAVIQIMGFKLGSVGLLLGQGFGQGFGTIAIYRGLLKRDKWRLRRPEHLLIIAKRYKHFPLYSTWAGLLNAAGSNVPPILFATLFSTSSAGIYGLANKIVAMPMSVLGKAVSQVFLSNAAIDYRNGNLPPLVISAQRALIKIVVIPSIFLVVFSVPIFPLVFGAEWGEAGEVASWLALWMLVAFSTSPLSSIFAIIEKQRLGLIMQGVLFGFRVMGIGIGLYYNSFMVAVIWFSILSIVGYLSYQIVAFISIGLTVSTSLKGYIIPLILLGISFAIKGNLSNNTLILLFSFGCIVSTLYYLHLFKRLKG
ncbi:MAG: oligosaccharide flippase family protein [Idiomarina sp.]